MKPYLLHNASQFEFLFREHYADLCRFAMKYVDSPDLSEEMVQEVFVRIWEKREQISIESSVKSYLFRAVRNQCLNYIRQKKYKTQPIQEESIQIVTESTDTQTDYKELQKEIAETIQTLPEKCRAVFLLHREEQLTYIEIANQLNISVKTVEAHMGKALKILRKSLKEYI